MPAGSAAGALDSSNQSGFSSFQIAHFGDEYHTRQSGLENLCVRGRYAFVDANVAATVGDKVGGSVGDHVMATGAATVQPVAQKMTPLIVTVFDMKFIILVTVAIFLWTNAVAGQKARAPLPEKVPTVPQIVERYLRSTGGRRAWASLTSLYSRGTLRSGDRPNGTVEVFQTKPLKYLKIFHGPVTELRLGFDGTRSWSRFKNDPAHFNDPSPSNLAAFVADIDLLAFVNFEARFPGAAIKGTEDLADGQAYVIAATPAGSDWVVRFYFDVKSGLLVRQDAEFDEEGVRKTTTNYLDRYGPSGNIRVAFRTRAYYDNVLTETFYTEITPNKPMPDALFDLPLK